MKVQSFIIPKSLPSELYFQVDRGKRLYPKLHQHKEVQLSLIIEGNGLLFVNGAFKSYKPLDLIIIGSESPHMFVSDKNCEKVEMQSFYFNVQNLVGGLINQAEVKDIIKLFQQGKYGFIATSGTQKAIKIFKTIHKKQGLSRKIDFLTLLECLKMCSFEGISFNTLNPIISSDQGVRMRNVIDFTLNNHNKQINLNQVAEIACLTRNSFCKYFKAHYNKTFFTFLNEIRISRSLTLMTHDLDLSINEVAFLVGFNRRAQFTKIFYKIKKMTPTEYKKKLIEKMNP